MPTKGSVQESSQMEEQRASNGNVIALACGPLKKQRYINPKIEVELNDFKKEINDKFAKSALQSFVMPRVYPREKSPEESRLLTSGIAASLLRDSTENSSNLSNKQLSAQMAVRNRNHHRFLAQSTDANSIHSYLQSV